MIQMAESMFNSSKGITTKNDAIIPIPQTLKIILRFFLLGVISPTDLVNKHKELYASKPKKAIAEILCNHPLTATGKLKVPTFSILLRQGNKQMQIPSMPAIVQTISSCLSYPLYVINNIPEDPRIIINGVIQVGIQYVADIDEGIPNPNTRDNNNTIQGNNIPNQPNVLRNLSVSITIPLRSQATGA